MDKYQYIKNPITNRKVRTDTRLGKNIINKYIQKGGLYAFDIDETPEGSGIFNQGCFKSVGNPWSIKYSFTDALRPIATFHKFG